MKNKKTEKNAKNSQRPTIQILLPVVGNLTDKTLKLG